MRGFPISQNLYYNLNTGSRNGVSLKKLSFHFDRNNKGFAKANLRLLDIRITTSTQGVKLKESIYILNKDGKYGVANKEGKIIINCKYSGIEANIKYALKASEYTYIIMNEEYQYGLIDSNGKTLLPIKYSQLKQIDKNRYIAGVDYFIQGIIDSSGKEILKQQYTYITEPIENTVLVGFFDEKKLQFYNGIYDINGKNYVPADSKSGYQAYTSTDSKSGYQTISRDYYITNTEQSLLPIADENIIIIANSKKKWGVVDRKGKEIVKFENDGIYEYEQWIDKNSAKMKYVSRSSLQNVKPYVLKKGKRYGMVVYFKQ